MFSIGLYRENMKKPSYLKPQAQSRAIWYMYNQCSHSRRIVHESSENGKNHAYILRQKREFTRVSISKKSRISSFFVHSDVNLVTLVLFASLNDALVVFSYIFKRIYGARQLSVYSLLSGLVPRTDTWGQ